MHPRLTADAARRAHRRHRHRQVLLPGALRRTGRPGDRRRPPRARGRRARLPGPGRRRGPVRAGILLADGTLDRQALANIVFGDDGARAHLEAIIHPEVYRRIRTGRPTCPPARRWPSPTSRCCTRPATSTISTASSSAPARRRLQIAARHGPRRPQRGRRPRPPRGAVADRGEGRRADYVIRTDTTFRGHGRAGQDDLERLKAE
jgi:hypothetical protein